MLSEKDCIECSLPYRPVNGSQKVCPPCRPIREKRMKAEHRARNRESNIQYNREWRKANPTYHSEYNKRWRKANPVAYKAAYTRYREENLDTVRARFADWESKNPQHTTDWARRNREAAREQVRRRRARLREVPTFLVTARDIRRLVARHDYSCAYCRNVLGDSYHIDHIVPVSRGGSNGIGNLAPACPTCNTSKFNRLLVEWSGRPAL